MVNFLKYSKLYVVTSLTVILLGLASIILWQYHYSIDFTGGTILEYQVGKQVSPETVKSIADKQKLRFISQEQKNSIVTIRLSSITPDKEKVFTQELVKNYSGKLLRSETVGATLGSETLQKTLIASLVAIVGILLYLIFAFRSLNYAVAAIVALVHDLLVMVGSYSVISHFFGAELNTLFVTALLTTMSFSVHDTIVIFDKMREYRRSSTEPVEQYANRAIIDTFIRSLNNSMTIIFMLLALILFGGSTIRFFIIALLVGTITGTYSSPFVATPVLVWLEKRRRH